MPYRADGLTLGTVTRSYRRGAWGDDVRQGSFEEVPDSGEPRVYRLRWESLEALTEQEKNYAHFVRYLITVGHLNERAERPRV